MMDSLVTVLTVTSGVSAAMMAGLYFAFSTSVMGGLRQQPQAQGAATMQSVNEVILNPLFMLLFAGSTLACVALAITAKLSDQPLPWLRIGAAVLFVLGSFVLTAAVNVPLNNKLAAVDPTSAHGMDVWRDYLSTWTAWNHVRAGSSLLAAILLTASLTSRG
jgi:uncharacterized membrane protein